MSGAFNHGYTHISTGQRCSDPPDVHYIYLHFPQGCKQRLFQSQATGGHIYILYVRQLAAALVRSD